ncbi:MAG: AMIN domain-containing protein [Tissierellia bacterium]|nr:AMIN domain-containing protein [Tissierellia bacterium]
MKRYMKYFLLICVLLMWNTKSVSADSMSIKIDNQIIKTSTVNVELNGARMQSEFPAFLLNDRTFIPIREVTEYFKAEVKWDGATNTATILKDGKEIKLTLNSTKAYVNGVETTISSDSIAKMAVYNSEGKTVVPLRLLSELLGYEVGWNSQTRVASINGSTAPVSTNGIVSIEETNGSSKAKQVKIKSTGPIDYTINHNQDHNTVTIVTKGSQINIGNQQFGTIQFNSEIIDIVEYNRADANGNGTIVIHLKKNVSVREKLSADRKELNISFTNLITNITPTKYDGKESIIVSGVKTSEYNIMKLDNPFRYVIDIKDATLYNGGSVNKNDVNTGFVKNIRASQFVPDKNYHEDDNIVRIVLDPKVGVDDAEVKIVKSGDDLILVLSSYEEIISSTILDPGDIESLGESILIPDFSKPNIIEREKKKVSNISELVVVVDAGHGGKQPGTSKGDYLEKEFNLDVALKLERKLKNLGFTVKMIRTGDNSVDNFERANIANESMADMYVSIHANSALNPDASGIEVLYYPNDTGAIKYEDQSPFAKSILDGVVRSTGAKNRGIIKRPDLIVLKNTQMSAALVECGFISNEAELDKLKSDAYQDLIAEGIANGIRNYTKSNYGI